MPRGDRTGPEGRGPMTGRAGGFCAGYSQPGYANPWPRGGWGATPGFSRGGGRGWRHMYYATGLTGWQRGYPASAYPSPAGEYLPVPPPMTQQQEIEGLKGQAEYLENVLGEVRKRLDELASETKEE